MNLFVKQYLKHIKSSPDYDFMIDQKYIYEEDFGSFSTNEYLLMWFIVENLNDNKPIVYLLKLLGKEYRDLIFKIYQTTWKKYKPSLNWADECEKEDTYENYKQFIKDFCGDYYFKLLPEKI